MPDSLSATLPAPVAAYGTITRFLHLVGALVIIATWCLGISLESFPSGPTRLSAVGVHTMLGLTVFSLSVLRILWRLATRAPDPAGPAWMRPLAKLVHVATYLVTVALPVSGLLARWAHSGAASMPFGWSIPAPFTLPKSEVWGEVHEALALTLAALVVLHIVAALVHQFVLRDGSMRRMTLAGR